MSTGSVSRFRRVCVVLGLILRGRELMWELVSIVKSYGDAITRNYVPPWSESNHRLLGTALSLRGLAHVHILPPDPRNSGNSRGGRGLKPQTRSELPTASTKIVLYVLWGTRCG